MTAGLDQTPPTQARVPMIAVQQPSLPIGYSTGNGGSPMHNGGGGNGFNGYGQYGDEQDEQEEYEEEEYPSHPSTSARAMHGGGHASGSFR